MAGKRVFCFHSVGNCRGERRSPCLALDYSPDQSGKQGDHRSPLRWQENVYFVFILSAFVGASGARPVLPWIIHPINQESRATAGRPYDGWKMSILFSFCWQL
jgi:hypothetical protein